MQKQFFDGKNGLWYELHGDYYLPCLTVPLEEQRPVGVWGQRHLRYLRQHRRPLYTELLVASRLNGYLEDLNEQVEDLFSRLVEQMAAREGITEQLKAQNQMLWVQQMNNIRERAMEVVNNDLIYTYSHSGGEQSLPLFSSKRRTSTSQYH